VKLVLAFIFITLLQGCSQQHSIDTGDVGSITILFDNKLHTYKPDSSISLGFIDWLNKNRDGWESYYATVAPGVYVIKANSFTLNIREQFAVLNYQDSSGNYNQLSKQVAIQDFDFIGK
jgi:hypothetical protein